MPNLQDHVLENGGQTLAERPFDALDGLALSQVIYMPMEDISKEEFTISELWAYLHEAFPDSFTDPFQKKRYAFTRACAESVRYRDWLIRAYVNHVDPRQETQFCACTFELPDGNRFCSFRGTDLTLAGWKEDLNMSFMIVPAQTESVAYVEAQAEDFDGKLLLGGHSKGGNLSAYATAHVSPDIRERITHAYSFDGPGVDDETIHSEAYAQALPRIESFIPQSSVVGMLLCYHPIYTVVKSPALGLFQHDALTWQISDGAFETLPDLDAQGKLMDEALRQWIDNLTFDDRRLLSDTVFHVVSQVDPETIDPLVQNFSASSLKMLAAFHKLDPKVRTATQRLLHELFASGASAAARRLLPRTIRGFDALPLGKVIAEVKTERVVLRQKLTEEKEEKQKEENA